MIYENFPNLLKSLLSVGSKFGYINKKIYLNHLGSTSSVYKFRIWKQLLSLRLVSCYADETFSDNYFYLNKKGKALMQAAGFSPVTKIHPVYFKHDNAIMKFALENENSQNIKASWITEGVLKQYDNVKLNQIFRSNLGKYPDLFFELNLSGQTIRIALEIEKSAKGQSRYDAFIIGYSKAQGVDMVLVAHSHKYTKEALLLSMRKLGYPRSKRPLAFCAFTDIINNPKNFILEIEGNRVRFADYVKNIQRLVEEKQKNEVKSQLTSQLT